MAFEVGVNFLPGQEFVARHGGIKDLLVMLDVS